MRGGRRGGAREALDTVDDMRDGAVGDGVDSSLDELLLELGVPVIFHVVVGSSGELVCDDRPPR